MPELEKALKAVEQMDENEIKIVRTYNNPPQAVVMVLEAVLTLLG